MKRTILSMAIALLCSAWTAVALADNNGENKGKKHRVLKFEVSELSPRFVFDETPLDADGKPGSGNEFVTEGVIYAAETLQSGDDGVITERDANNKVISAKPKYPDRVIGRWTCRGWHVGEGAATKTGPWVITHQFYDFDQRPGEASFTTDGVELVDIDVAIKRAITGGTGPYKNMRGETVQTMIGFNSSDGVNLRFEIRP
ncbi:MAG: hypothetical protein FJ147_28320 [Deltaproteobacteria bacterium]|nr:hypothetical protein [Deltaproteobacteria bacterium]